jgi:diguanylate cyclase (GGDEF)-like protein
MATLSSDGFTVDLADRLAGLERLLVQNPSCVVGVLDPARNIGDAGPLLADVGISVEGHPSLVAGAVSQFLAISDVWLLGDAALEAGVQGSATRAVRLHGGDLADLHLVEIGVTDLRTVVVIVPSPGSVIAGTPPPTAVAASPRIGEIWCDAYGVITSSSPSTLVLLGRPGQSVDGTPIVAHLHPDDHEAALVNWLAAKEQRGVALRWRCRLVRSDGSPLWVEITITYEIEADGNGEVRFLVHDISREIAATDALIAERALIDLLTETLPVGVAKFDAQGRVEHANRRLSELLAPLDPNVMLDQAVGGELEDLDLTVAFAALLRDGVPSRLVVDHVLDDATVRHLEWTIRAVLGEGGDVTGGVVCIADVTESTRLRAQLESRARTDALTACLNRAGAVAALEHALADVRPSEGVGLLFIDLDGFKGVNDSRGHAIGDAVLEEVARRLRSASRPIDLVGRLGGDEFVVIAPSLHSASAAFVFAGRISRQLQGPAVIGGIAVPISASIGVAWASTSTASDLLSEADAAMYVAKQTHSDLPVLSEARAADRIPTRGR